VTIQIKAVEQYFHVVTFIILNMVVLTLKSVDEISKCVHSNESYWAVICCSADCCFIRWFSLPSLWMKFVSVTIQMKATEQYFPVVLLIMLYKMVLTFESVDKILSEAIQLKATEQFFP